ncbi:MULTISPECIES: ABC transporter ATP-binding protein [unclassified Microbacterium]|uniref:ABC transporter ATP-binding protein n=1 Tax=unclassified Microbacterium TaxID=2609290 RepID=UPI000CFB4BE3|nr:MULTISPECIES: ABC transporter ATP-binding protein [unclassified Microbacterium]PQZ58005.1 ABC transporter [Microbacterium sp. MYb43]PQZ80779.1 ABC transporter [Microbacterium sp. MYb40]PRB20292.1 ABC transporter [Microbacterium sp. MYb54]PRB31963.1 ABC transporter [Microbacterium sp. MYb50]PRB66447.1 ABC transporter [Microbacterium sp. MYb24]
MLTATALGHTFSNGRVETLALDGVSCAFEPGSFTAIMGPSGSGKSTLLYCLAGLIRASAGSVTFDATELTTAKQRQLDLLRRDEFGFIFQSFNLIDALTALQNVTLPSLFGGAAIPREQAVNALANVGLSEKVKSYPAELSGGQQQRVAIARALAQTRRVIFADEPTGALDRKSGFLVMDQLRQFRDVGTAVVMVTHDPQIAAYADRVLFLVDGRLVDTMDAPTAEAVSSRMTGLESAAR